MISVAGIGPRIGAHCRFESSCNRKTRKHSADRQDKIRGWAPPKGVIPTSPSDSGIDFQVKILQLFPSRSHLARRRFRERSCAWGLKSERPTHHFDPAFERTWRTEDSQGHILALSFRRKPPNPFKLSPLHSEAVGCLVRGQQALDLS